VNEFNQLNKARATSMARAEVAKSTHREAVNTAKSSETEMREIESTIRDLNSAQSDSGTKFGKKMPLILRDIAAEKRFEHKPVGPLGSYVKMRPGADKWVNAVSAAIGKPKTLKKFVVNSFRDQQVTVMFAREKKNY
jgi:chromosome segregation ATPase